MRLKFDEQLNNLNREMISMGALCEDAINLSFRILSTGEISEDKKIREICEQINHKEREIENMCLKLMMKQQPVASDLRVISASLKIVTDLERIGDNADDIAEIVSMHNIPIGEDHVTILSMAKAAGVMVTDAIDAFVNRDSEKAQVVIDKDDEVDSFFDQVKIKLAGQFTTDEKDIERVMDLLMIAKYYERIADHAVNISKWVQFVTGGNLAEELS